MDTGNTLFCEWYEQWVETYKKGAVRNVTLKKYELTIKWLKKLIPNLRIGELDRMHYQSLLNAYAEEHEKQTVMDFHHHLKGAILADEKQVICKDHPDRLAGSHKILGTCVRIKKR